MNRCNVCKKPKIKILTWVGQRSIEREICLNPYCSRYENNVHLFKLNK